MKGRKSELKRFTDQKSPVDLERITCCSKTERKGRQGRVKAKVEARIGVEETKGEGRKGIKDLMREGRERMKEVGRGREEIVIVGTKEERT